MVVLFGISLLSNEGFLRQFGFLEVSRGLVLHEVVAWCKQAYIYLLKISTLLNKLYPLQAPGPYFISDYSSCASHMLRGVKSILDAAY